MDLKRKEKQIKDLQNRLDSEGCKFLFELFGFLVVIVRVWHAHDGLIFILNYSLNYVVLA